MIVVLYRKYFKNEKKLTLVLPDSPPSFFSKG